ncbi:MAG: flagellar basal body rod C-terminal domain-containing protein, partial [Lachnospiraceae bacterium]|nr:flagellar basal body rod C-terminal domain-containing protein [Lachnospiraceae bacterium]
YDQANTVTALGIKVNDEFLNNLRLLPTGTKMVNGKENTDVVDKMLQIKKSHFLNSDSPAGYLESIVAQIATDTKIARTFESNYSSIETIIDKQRMSISGVDRDEEAMNLVKYQNAYELSSKMIQVLTEIYDRLILETGI